MSRFMYFLGGCAAGALAVAAIQALTEDEYSSDSSTYSQDDIADDIENDVDASHCAEGTTEDTEPVAQNIRAMAEAMTNAMKNGMTKDGNDPAHCPADMQKMSEQLASSVIGIMSEFLRQSQAAANEANATTQNCATVEGVKANHPVSPITPCFGTAQA